MGFNLKEAISIANTAVFSKFRRHLTDIEIMVIKGAWEREEYDQIAAKHQYATSYISQDIAPRLWKLLTEALEEKVKKSNFKEALKRYWEKQLIAEHRLASSELIAVNGQSSNGTSKKTTPLLYLVQSRKHLLASEVYIDRYPAESQCYENLLQPGSLVRVEAPKLMGKTSLMERVLAKLKKQGDRAASLSLKMADRQTHLPNLNKLLRWFCLNLTRQLNLPNRLDEYWDAEGIGAKVSCTTYLEEYLLAAAESSLVLFLDDVDALLPYPEVCEDFFELLRCWYEKSRTNQNWQKLRLAIAHTCEVYTCLHIHQSPFSVGLSIELPELTKEQVQAFAKQCGWAENLSLLEPLMQLLGGHPYLWQQAFLHFKNYPNINLEQFVVEAHTNAGIYRHHLRELWLKLQQNPKLMAAFQAVRDSNQPISLEALSAYQLQSIGLVKFEGKQVKTGCQLYSNYFSDMIENWVKIDAANLQF